MRTPISVRRLATQFDMTRYSPIVARKSANTPKNPASAASAAMTGTQQSADRERPRDSFVSGVGRRIDDPGCVAVGGEGRSDGGLDDLRCRRRGQAARGV